MNADVIVTLNGLAGIKSPSALVCAAFMFTSPDRPFSEHESRKHTLRPQTTAQPH